ncbi:MAG: VWA domain-containing protein [Acidobacteriota bacterium]
MHLAHSSVRRRLLTASLALFGLLVFGEMLAAQSPFGEVVNVRVVNVEVVVTDGQGVRVTGLGPEDFRLRVDGEDRAIDYFSEIRGGELVPRQESAGKTPEGAGPRPAADPRGGTSYLVFIDEVFSLASDRDRVLRELVEQLPQLSPDDRMAVVAYNSGGLEMLTSWTESGRELERVFKGAMLRSSSAGPLRSQVRAADRDELDLDSVATAGDEPDFLGAVPPGVETVQGLDLEDEAIGERWSVEVDKAVSAASTTLRAFARPPGRKVMLLLSGGWPFSLSNWIAGRSTPGFRSPRLADGFELYSPLTDTANRLGYTLYPVDMPGLPAVDLMGDAAVDRLAIERRREIEIHATLDYLAQETGGRPLIDGDREAALERVVEDTRSYYWLGFTVDPQETLDRQKIRVRLHRKGLEARARRNFQPLTREQEESLQVESALRFGDPPREAPLTVALGEPERAGRRRMEVPVQVAIPLDMVTFVPTADGVEGRLELRIAAQDEGGDLSDIPILGIPVRLPQAPEAGKYARFDTSVTLRREKNRLIFSLTDPPTGRTASARMDVEP